MTLTNDEIGRLHSFALDALEVWPDGDLDGGTLQDLAVKHGLLEVEVRTEPCCADCECKEFYSGTFWARGISCYRKAAFLRGKTNG